MGKPQQMTASQLRDRLINIETIREYLGFFNDLVRFGMVDGSQLSVAKQRVSFLRSQKITIMDIGEFMIWCGWPSGCVTVNGDLWFHERGRLTKPIELEKLDNANLYSLANLLAKIFADDPREPIAHL